MRSLPLRKLTAKEHHKIWWAKYGHIVCAMRKEKRAELRVAKQAAVDKKFKVRPLPKVIT